MWEHVPLAWALISLATSESTQELLAEKEKSGTLEEVLFLALLFSTLGPDIARKFKLRIIQTSLLKKRRIISAKSIHHGSTCSAHCTLAASFNIHKRKKQMCNINRIPIEVEHPSTNTKRWMFGAFIHVAEMTNNEATARSIPTLSLQLNPQPLE